ncbi:phospholipase A2-like isoform X2 [Harmonia axyridis]|uniref:phospholipase A2-like isoform X2 n=1 Tax=Harmonia axyridis TaxID=115357 RepID=UPI001E276DE9|nr:phospholipase A2-like isoform X2 [Harmonia axyridis]
MCSPMHYMYALNFLMACHNTSNDFFTITSPVGSFQRIQWIYPGTKWCGTGDIADNYNDLGKLWKTDSCCRTHDQCPFIINGGETKYNLSNTSFHTKLHCSCDDEFYYCLKDVGSVESDFIGYMYFNLIGTQCFKKDHPIKKCLIFEHSLYEERS